MSISPCKNILVIVPHGDDETLLCGGLISKYSRQGHKIHVAFVRGAHDERTQLQQKHTEAAKHILGIQSTYCMDLSEEVTANNFLSIKQKVEEIVNLLKPEIVITTFAGDNHQDHKNVFRAVSVACRVHAAPWVRQILIGEINSSTDQDLSSEVFVPNYYVTLEEADIIAKCKAMEAYETERRESPHPRSPINIRALAMVRGMAVGVKYAEAYNCLRFID